MCVSTGVGTCGWVDGVGCRSEVVAWRVEGGGWTEVPAMDNRMVAKNHYRLCIKNRNASVGALVKLTVYLFPSSLEEKLATITGFTGA